MTTDHNREIDEKRKLNRNPGSIISLEISSVVITEHVGSFLVFRNWPNFQARLGLCESDDELRSRIITIVRHKDASDSGTMACTRTADAAAQDAIT